MEYVCLLNADFSSLNSFKRIISTVDFSKYQHYVSASPNGIYTVST